MRTSSPRKQRKPLASSVLVITTIVAVILVGMTLLPMIVLEASPDHHPDQFTDRGSLHQSSASTPGTPKTKIAKDGRRTILDIQLSDLVPDPPNFASRPVARGVAGRPLEQTPALQKARRGHIECDINVDSLAYWNVDEPYQTSPFAVEGQKFLTFTPDMGGWNNVRMSLEVVFVLAAATGRTLVLPPPIPLYLLTLDKGNQYRHFGDFFPLDQLQHRVQTMTMQEYVHHRAAPPVPDELNQDDIFRSAEKCINYRKSEIACDKVNDYLKLTGTLVNVSMNDCLVLDEEAYTQGAPSEPSTLIQTFCGERRQVYWNQIDHSADVLFLDAGAEQGRLLAHFYNTLLFTNPRYHNYYSRFVRDYLHYHDTIYCAAAKIVKALQVEAKHVYPAAAAAVDVNGAGGYSALHVRRGDLQFPEVKFESAIWFNNTKEVWWPNELIYVATDERNKTFFDDFGKHHSLRFLDDYWELAGLADLDPNYMGMVDTIVASRARAYAGTWFSTFSGYINRLRGYHGLSMRNSWYSWLPRKTKLHTWEVVSRSVYAYEYMDGWVGIDADVFPNRDKDDF